MRTLITTLFLVLLSASAAWGQAWDVMLDVGGSVADAPYPYPELTGVDANVPGFGIGLFSRAYVPGESPWRKGLVIRRRTIDTRFADRPEWNARHAALTFQLALGRLLTTLGPARVSAELGAGFSFFSDDFDDGNPDNWDFPSGSLELSPGLQVTVPVTTHLGLLAGGRWTIYLDGEEDTFPFKSGPVAFLGVQLSGK